MEGSFSREQFVTKQQWRQGQCLQCTLLNVEEQINRFSRCTFRATRKGVAGVPLHHLMPGFEVQTDVLAACCPPPYRRKTWNGTMV